MYSASVHTFAYAVHSMKMEHIGLSENKDRTRENVDMGNSDVEQQPLDDAKATDERRNPVADCLHRMSEHFSNFKRKHLKTITKLVYLTMLSLYAVYLGFAISYSIDGAMGLIVITSLVLASFGIGYIHRKFEEEFQNRFLKPLQNFTNQHWKYLKWLTSFLFVAGFVLFIVLDAGLNTHTLQSLGGLAIFVFIGFITSKHPLKINWRPVLWGLALQFLLGLIILRWNFGFKMFQFLGSQVKAFAGYADEGSRVVFGAEGLRLHQIAFKVLPVIVFFSSVSSILYHLGVVQYVTTKAAIVMEVTMTTTAVESLHAAASIFAGQIIATVMFKPFLKKLTKSELTALMTAGFATISVTVFAAYVEFGAPAEHVLSASIMSSPAALAIAKLSYPETETSTTKSQKDVQLPKGNDKNVIEAAFTGACDSVKLVGVVAANLIAFLGLMAFVNALLSYLGGCVGYPEITVQFLCSYAFLPLAYVMGIDLVDAKTAGSLLGVKIFLNEFIAFSEMKTLIVNHEIMVRTKTIMTYALCGFGSIASTGIYLAALCIAEPSRKTDLVDIALRSLFCGNLACFMTAAIAGLLYVDRDTMDTMNQLNNSTFSNTTMVMSIVTNTTN